MPVPLGDSCCFVRRPHAKKILNYLKLSIDIFLIFLHNSLDLFIIIKHRIHYYIYNRRHIMDIGHRMKELRIQ